MGKPLCLPTQQQGNPCAYPRSRAITGDCPYKISNKFADRYLFEFYQMIRQLILPHIGADESESGRSIIFYFSSVHCKIAV